MSLQENSESGEDDRESEDRRPCFSSECPPNSAAECELDLLGWEDNVRRGMFAGRRGTFGEEIVKVVSCFAAALCVEGSEFRCRLTCCRR